MIRQDWYCIAVIHGNGRQESMNRVLPLMSCWINEQFTPEAVLLLHLNCGRLELNFRYTNNTYNIWDRTLLKKIRLLNSQVL